MQNDANGNAVFTNDFLSWLISGKQSDRRGSWLDYPGVAQQAGSRHDTLYRLIKDPIQSIASQVPFLAPFASIISRGVGAALVGRPRNRYGIPTQFGFMPAGWGGGTAGSAFQTSLYRNSKQSIQAQQQRIRDQLRDKYLQQFYNVLYPGDQGKAQRTQAIAAAKNNPFGLPRVLSFALDPTQLRRQSRNIQDTAYNTLQYGIQRNPLNINNTRFAALAQQAAKNIAIEAADRPQQYGGFTPAAVTEMANALSKGQDVFKQSRATGDASEQDLKRAVGQFTNKVKSFTSALQPLRDIFGNNVQHMVDMITTLSGLPIGQLSTQQVQRYATNVANTVRATGLAPAALVPYVTGINKQLNQYGADSITRLAGFSIGTQLAVLGNRQGPGTMSRAQYIGQITNAYASGQSSINTRRIAQAYGIAVNQGNFEGSIQQFVSQIRKSSNPLQAAMDLANVKTIDQLLRGSGYRETQFALRDKQIASLAVQQQYKQQMKAAINNARWSDKRITNQDQIDMRKALLNTDQNSQFIARLFGKQGVTLQDIATQFKLDLNNTDQKDRATRLMRLANIVRTNQPQLGALATGIVQALRHTEFQRVQKSIAQAFADQNGKPTGGIYTVLSNFIDSGQVKGISGNAKKQNDQKSAVQRYLTLFGQQIFGVDPSLDSSKKLDAVKVSMRNLTTALGGNKDVASNALIAATSGAFSTDSKYRESLKTLSTAEAGSKQYKDAADYIYAAMTFGDTKNGVTLLQSLPQKQRDTLRTELFNKLNTASDKKNWEGYGSRQSYISHIVQQHTKKQLLPAAAKARTQAWVKSIENNKELRGISKDAAGQLQKRYVSGDLKDWSQIGQTSQRQLGGKGVTEKQYRAYKSYMQTGFGKVSTKPAANLQTVLGSLDATLRLLASAVDKLLSGNITGKDNKGSK